MCVRWNGAIGYFEITFCHIVVMKYQEFACCASLPGNGTNREQALHLLQKCNGSTKVGRKSSVFENTLFQKC